ncbi:MAG: pyruvate dehydrogenase (acetyl-transferring), homodimeric type, partial [Rhodoferax sp.]|nr:pyruvate dehydrogenase (acetyl-transferring), homodimeric type [Rhodoferax sp.]
VDQQDVFYYVTMMNENYAQPDLPVGVESDVIRGCYLFGSYLPAGAAGHGDRSASNVTLMGSGAILPEVIKAARQLAAAGIAVQVFSVTSWSELARGGRGCTSGLPFVTQQLQRSHGPIIAATDYVCAVPESVRAFIPDQRPFVTLGTDGFGRSDTRAALRSFFGVDAVHIEAAARRALGV